MVQQQKQHVLLVDDEPQILTALEDLLADDYTIFKSETPQRALDFVREDEQLAVVITDQRMPHMNGDEFLSRIADYSQALRIMVSGFADLPAVLRAVNDGKVYAYITKPWDEHDLLQKVQGAAAHFRLARELERERRLLRDLMDNSPDGIYFKDGQLRFLRANASFARALGRSSADELVGQRLSDLLPDDQTRAAEAEDLRVLGQREPLLDVVREQHSGGRRYFISETKAPIQNAAGVALGLVGISRDVTDRIETSEALRDREAALQRQTGILNSILSGMGEGVVVSALDGSTLLFNQEASRILGLTTRDVRAEDWPATYGLHATDSGALLSPEANPFCRALRGEPLVELDVRVSNSVVARALVAITATPLKDADGRITGAIALLRDVTAQRDLEQQLLQSQKMEAIGQLAGGIAHDFNNLLTVIVGCGELALDDLGEAHPSRMNLLELLAASNRATLMTRQLLAFSRQQVVQLQEIQLNDVVAGFESMLRRLIPSRVELAILPRANLSSITADKSQLEQVILNLAINACDAMSNGGTLRIETDEETIGGGAASELGALRGRYVSLTVLDTGTGMSEETRKRIFEPFFTTKELGKGTGLGLSTVYGIVRQSGGVIQVQSAPGQGSEFRILWPRSARHAARPSSIPPRAPWLEKVSILLLEPDDSVRKIAARILRSQGHVVREVAALGEALGIIADTRESFDLLLLEIGQAVPALRDALAASRPNIRQLLLVGGSSGAHYENRSPTQATLLAKPFSRAELLEKIEAALTAEASAQAS